jgi:hypothetical protein
MIRGLLVAVGVLQTPSALSIESADGRTRGINASSR